ncbi:CU044_5270 family protein [Thermomonospora cellulosilytica]|uniref:CU044_5270 family protein n=1 Tax=Thermomonospora cellulosilytica TaxID=1411118 RepID=A0A7W3R6Q7_9ACTN|nr:CU044_5270 family protein [Thermomonospora cellulosilytica]MBA9002443.1 hypothetical protein [Thermomonospora cellulosilytica]
MNELQMIAEMLDENPSERTVAEGRERLRGAVSGGRAPAGRRRRFGMPRWPLGLGLAGAAAAVAVAVAVSGTTPPDPAPQPSAQDLSARTVLLAAAEKATTTPDAKGTYWRVKTLTALPVTVGPKDNRYTMERLRIREHWTTRQGREWVGDRLAGARPRTPADEAAWRKDGSPTRWDLGVGDTVDRQRIHLHTAPRPGTLIDAGQTRGFSIGERWLTFEQVQSLPTDPRALRAALTLTRLRDDKENPDRANPVPPEAQAIYAAQSLTALLAQVPAPPKVRAAAFRALADMPEARSLGRVKDPQGRTGVGIVITNSYQGATTTTRLIVDPATSSVLSSNITAGRDGARIDKEMATVYLEVGWTDTRPQPPSLP